MNKRYNHEEIEPKIQNLWSEMGIFKFDPEKKNVFSIDTPPPTVSGKLHIGHVMHYSQFEFVARFKRMQGFNVFFPFGFDDNGLATEILTENEHRITAEKIGRDEFVKLVKKTVEKYIGLYKDVWKRMGMSCDWSLEYRTIEPRVQRISQLSFLDLWKKKRVYRKKSPIIWCPKCQTAIAQVEQEDKTLPSVFYDILFELEGEKEKIIISTTRPELLPSCAAVFVNPDDEKNKRLIKKKAVVPIFGQIVPIIADRKVDPTKGSGIVMCCTFGDVTDIEWYYKHKLPLKMCIDKEGKITELGGKYAGMKIADARKTIVEDLEKMGIVVGKKPVSHTVNVHERCGTPVEYITANQWFIKYLDVKKEFLKLGKKIKWYPEHMYVRLENWINGLKWDWCISRQRYHGVPIPVWYCKKCGEIKVAEESQLPVDPINERPKGKCKCGSQEFEPEKDIFDTWMTSSLTPLINARWKEENTLMNKIYPMDLRPQAHDIITFWAFNTIVKGYFHTGRAPFKTIMISGHGLDKRGKKMSKSKGNVVEPHNVLKKYPADAIRYWASSASLGEDLPFQEKDLISGQKLMNKLWNASRFVKANLDKKRIEGKPKLEVIDEWILAKLNSVIREVTEGFEVYEYSKAKNKTEYFFWKDFCDNYLEIVKYRIYQNKKIESALWTLKHVLLNTLKLFAPIMPHITEEIYLSVFRNEAEKVKSIHISKWPSAEKINKKSEEIGDLCVKIISALRQWKHSKQLALNSKLRCLTLFCAPKERSMVEKVSEDIKGTMKIERIRFSDKPMENKIPGVEISFKVEK